MYALGFPGMFSFYWLSIASCSHRWLSGRSCHCCNRLCGATLLPIWLGQSMCFSPIFSMLASVTWYLPVRIWTFFLIGHSLNRLVPLNCPFSKTEDCFWWTVFRPKVKTIQQPLLSFRTIFVCFSELSPNNTWDLRRTRTTRNEHKLTNSSPIFLLSSRWRPGVAYKTPRTEDSHVHPSWPPGQCPSGSVDWPLLCGPSPQLPEGLPAAQQLPGEWALL